MPFQDHQSTKLLYQDEAGSTVKTAFSNTSYLRSLSSALLSTLSGQEDAEDAMLRKHVAPPLIDRLKSADHLMSIPQLDVDWVDIQVDIDGQGSRARAWCLNSSSKKQVVSRESVVVLEWELREHRTWICWDIKVVLGSVGF